jgi:excinuclease ABC subunit A
MSEEYIRVRGAKENNLRNVDIDIPKNKLVVITGLSGSGKSSLAFDTIYAEGQRRYVESLSTYARQFLQLQNKPDVESISGLSPAIAIDQKTTFRNPRSTVGTITEIYDYLRLLFARVGVPYSPATGLPIQSQNAQQIVDLVMKLDEGTKILILAPLVRGGKGEHRKEILQMQKHGFQRIRIDGILYDMDELPEIDKNKKHNIEIVVDRIEIASDIVSRLTDSVETSLKLGNGILMIVEVNEGKEEKEHIYSESFACPISGFQIEEIEPRIFSFNSPFGACKECDGLGDELVFDPERMVQNQDLSLEKNAIEPFSIVPIRDILSILNAIGRHYKFSTKEPYKFLSDEAKKIIIHGSDEVIEMEIKDGVKTKTVNMSFPGVIAILEQFENSPSGSWVKEQLSQFKSKQPCSSCGGYRLKPETLCIKIDDKHVGQVASLNVNDSLKFFEQLPSKLNDNQNKIGEKVIKEIYARLTFLKNVGVGYLTLSRESGTLSGGECQRIRLASQIGSGLCGVLYVLDEPSIGLHQRDNIKLIQTLKHLKSLGNSVIVVEHDNETISSADYIIDVGPGAGALGGLIVAEGDVEAIKNNPNSYTGMYLAGTKKIEVPTKLREIREDRQIIIRGARANNLKNVEASFPLGTFICVSGVSGGGKSSLVIHTLYKAAAKLVEKVKITPGPYDHISGLEYIDKVIEINQAPIGKTPRSNPATYTGAFNYIRDWFVSLPEAKARGYKPGRFSFNVKGGRCEACQGDGILKIEMHFLQDVYVKCEECRGARYNKATLEVKYNGKSISDVLEMTVEESCIFFANIPQIAEKVNALKEVGLGYIKLGQSATTLSGGEAQRVKLAKELSRKSTGRTLYILDEPTTGLHMEDISKLLKILHKLADVGNTVVVIEHNLDVIKTADYIIDIGPDGGEGGGQVLAFGRPVDVMNSKDSVTGIFLKDLL